MKQFVIKMKSGNNYIALAPDDWDFPTFVRSIHTTGYWCDANIYIALAEIAFAMPMNNVGILKTQEELAAMSAQGSA